MRVYKKAEEEVLAYQKAMEQYHSRGGQKPLEEESIREQLWRLAEEGKRNEISRKITVKKRREQGDYDRNGKARHVPNGG